MNNLKFTHFLIILSITFLPNALFASKTPPLNEDGQEQKPSVPQKVGRETARVIGQINDAGSDITKSFKKQRHKDQKKQKHQEK